MGVDLGQKRDPSAIVVAQQDDQEPPVFTIRQLERLPLGTSYPAVAQRIAEMARGAWYVVNGPVYDSAGQLVRSWRAGLIAPTVVVDATGLGGPVIEMLRAELNAKTTESFGPKAPAFQYELRPVTFTHGDRLTSTLQTGRSVGKAYLVSRLQVLLQSGRVRLPRNHPEADVLVRELLDYEIRVDEQAHDRYGAFAVGSHDDLVTALGLAVIEDRDPADQQTMIWDQWGRRVS